MATPISIKTDDRKGLKHRHDLSRAHYKIRIVFFVIYTNTKLKVHNKW